MISILTMRQFDKNNQERIIKLITKHRVQKIQEFKQFIIEKTDRFTKEIKFSEGALFISLYEGAMEELSCYDNWGITINDIFNNPDSPLRQVLQIFKTW